MFDTLEILCTHFSYNKKLKEEKKVFNVVADIQRVLKILKIRKLTLEGKIFKLLSNQKLFSNHL